LKVRRKLTPLKGRCAVKKLPADLVPKSLAVQMATWRRDAKPWKPWPYQERSLKFMLENSRAGLLLSPGMGKTSVSLAAIKILLKKKLVRRILIVAPLRPCTAVWPEQLCEWADFKDMRIALLHGPNKDKVLRTLTPKHQVAIINPEGCQWLMSKRANMKMLDADMLIIDESSCWKSSVTVRFRALRKWLPTFKRRYILTGSPRPNHYLDLFGQVKIMDLGAALGEYISHYRMSYFFPTGFQQREWEILPGAAAKIDKLVAPMVLRLDAKDYLKLPRELEQTHLVELPAKARIEYDKIESSLMSTLFTTPLVSSAAARSKCCQIANGSVYIDPGPEERWTKERPFTVVHTAKYDALADLVNELQGEALLVGIGYHHDVVGIRKALGYDVPCINGATTRTQSADYIEQWNKGQLPVLLGHPASMGHGLNLQKFNAQNVAFFDIGDNFDTYQQFFLRVCRQGNKATFVMRHHFVCSGTVDIPKMRGLRNKDTGQKQFLQAMKEYAEKKYDKSY
jgi:SNF2 family DNA or RNA helicase